MLSLPRIHKADSLVLLSTLVLFLSVFAGVSLIQRQQQIRRAKAATVWFVSKNGNNTDGRSWLTAWNELDRINWSIVQSGDTILIDGGGTPCAYPTNVTGNSNTPRSSSGGSCGMIYQSTLTPGKSGVSIHLAPESGRNGSIIIFGGRSIPLPYCGQSGYTWDPSSVRQDGINLGSVSQIVIDGTKWSGIIIYGTKNTGINLSNSSSDITIRNVEIYDNGSVRSDGNPDQQGVEPQGTRITFERAIVHDNGQDAFQSGGTIQDFTIRQSWLYNQRPHPTQSNEPFNYCRHSDGIQIYAGGEQYGLTIENSIFGPGFMQSLLLGGYSYSGGSGAIHNVSLRNTLIVHHHGSSANAGLYTHEGASSPATNYMLDRVTIVRDPGDQWWNTKIDGSGHKITNSIFYGGYYLKVQGNPTVSNNCYWQLQDQTGIGVNADPMFFDNNFSGVGAGFADFDFTPRSSTCSNKGSSIRTVAQLLGFQPTPPPLSTPTLTPTKSPTLTPPTTLPGDLDKDGDVDIFDYNILLENFGKTNCGNVADISPPAGGDCKVDIFDYNILIENFGKKA